MGYTNFLVEIRSVLGSTASKAPTVKLFKKKPKNLFKKLFFASTFIYNFVSISQFLISVLGLFLRAILNSGIMKEHKMKKIELTKIETIILLVILVAIGGLVLYGENNPNNFNPLDYVFKR